ncbi:pyrimidine-nucleoside phosphorylase [Tepidimicrobium xylanilyticum]|uniref:Pyrimidine-nucleoside phosphorylase n=1 Tax=Tepidimicrobium xylanilyticum TaxID=1123352 RepID=A0A1H3CU02_9FIRM|nr:pyrimidine-nucleoside phosphorylase [Tepidimicrobium xylanilyticum]GMG97738.1 pyrimidine-nucleoside phosphorylase [Tepidimicrobium xylanilyticum]SDX57651.1 pyrimidine-nucleoside phosphorylase [Tepidimicrobium xylanilyticum]
MRIYDIIKKKRDKEELTTEEINFIVEKYTNGEIPDYQMSALLMAIYFNKMNKRETLDLTKAMINSGDIVDLSGINGIKVDKHSTGGVGDTVTLIVGPMVAACGVPFVKMSGRGLGHTGGTLDKLESFRGFRVELDDEELINNANQTNICICSQTANIAPADKKLYALRDVTATVENLSLIASSIMSKKLAIGSNAIILDVKIGSGAFMKKLDDAIELAKAMVDIGQGYGRETIAVISNMDEPLGRAVGNALEVKEAIETLQGNGPEDLLQLSLFIGSKLLVLAKRVETEIEGRELLEQIIKSGAAYDKFKELVKYQEGDISQVENLNLLPKSEYIIQVKSTKSGYVKSLNAEEIGQCALLLGAGRENMESTIDYSSGIILVKKVDDKVEIDETLAEIHCNDMELGKEVEKRLQNIYVIGTRNEEPKKLIYGLVTKDGVELY